MTSLSVLEQADLLRKERREAPKQIELRGSRELPRNLHLTLSQFGDSISCTVGPPQSMHFFVFAYAEPRRCRLQIKERCLWIGHASFDLSETEIAEVVEPLRALGVSIVEGGSWTA